MLHILAILPKGWDGLQLRRRSQEVAEARVCEFWGKRGLDFRGICDFWGKRGLELSCVASFGDKARAGC